MSDWRTYFRGKKITMLGLGILGRGINDAKFLARLGATLTITDFKAEKELEPALLELEPFRESITYVLGEHRFEDFQKADLILKAAGVPLDSPYVKEAEKHGIPVLMDASLFASLSPTTIVGVTGTRGKSTTSHLLYSFLKREGKPAFLGGNIRGIATLPLLEETRKGDIVVLELDSWQLQGFGDAKISPHIAVFTNFLLDHMNYYKGDVERYFADKANIFKFQKEGDYLVTGKETESYIKEHFPHDIHSTLVSPEPFPPDVPMALQGEHNRENASLAAGAAKLLGVTDKTIRDTLSFFSGVPGRLELIATVDGISYYNDTTATTPDATMAGLTTLGREKKVILIMGGADKGLPMEKLFECLPQTTKTVILLPGTGTERVRPALAEIRGLTVIPVSSMLEALEAARESAREGDSVLLSPAFASFGLFKNEYDRGDQFAALVNRL